MCKLFPLPSYCEQNSSKHGWGSLGGIRWQTWLRKCRWCRMSSPLGTYQDEVQLGHMVDLFLTFWVLSTLTSRATATNYSPNSSEWGVPFPHIFTSICCQWFCWSELFWLQGDKNLTAVLICISLIAKDAEYFWGISQPFSFLLWRILCSDHRPTF